MDNLDFQNAIKSVLINEYNDSDIKIIKHHLNELLKKEVLIRQHMEKETSEYVKKKNKSKTDLKIIHNDIKEIRNILKHL